MTDTETGVDQGLLPDRSGAEKQAWYLAGVGATALLTGVMGLIDQAPSYGSMALTGGILLIGVALWMVRA